MTTLTKPDSAAIMERVVIAGDLKNLSAEERVQYYSAVCESVGLNPLTKPFEYIELNNRLTLYALKTTTDQLRQIHQISLTIVSREVVNGVYVVTAQASTPDGRRDESIGAVPLEKEGGEWKAAASGKRYFQKNGGTVPLAGEDLANAYMKAETKAKRRVTLSICGLGWLDESEVGSVPSARTVQVSQETGEIQSSTAPAAAPDNRHHVQLVQRLGENASKIRERYPDAGPRVEELLSRYQYREDAAQAQECSAEIIALAKALHAREQQQAQQPAEDVVDAELVQEVPTEQADPLPEFDPNARSAPASDGIGNNASRRLHQQLGAVLKGSKWEREGHAVFVGRILSREVDSLAALRPEEARLVEAVLAGLSSGQSLNDAISSATEGTPF